jgi:uncharacterized protein YycO
MTPQPGDVFMVSGMSVPDRLIQFAQRRRDGNTPEAKWSHCAMCIGGDFIIEAAGTHGVRINTMTAYVDMLTRVYATRGSKEQRIAACRYAHTQLGLKYDWVDIPSIGLNLLFGNPFAFHGDKKLICSWLVSNALLLEGYTLPRDACNMGPGDVAWLLEGKPHLSRQP